MGNWNSCQRKAPAVPTARPLNNFNLPTIFQRYFPFTVDIWDSNFNLPSRSGMFSIYQSYLDHYFDFRHMLQLKNQSYFNLPGNWKLPPAPGARKMISIYQPYCSKFPLFQSISETVISIYYRVPGCFQFINRVFQFTHTCVNFKTCRISIYRMYNKLFTSYTIMHKYQVMVNHSKLYFYLPSSQSSKHGNAITQS